MTDENNSPEQAAASDDTAAAEPSAAVEPAPAATAEATRPLQRTTHGQTLFDRFISPVLLPLGAVALIIFVVLNLSRVLLAGTGGGAHGGEGGEGAAEAPGHPILPLVVAATLTVLILVFASSFAAAKKMRTHTIAVFSVVVLGAIVFAGWLSVGDAQEKVAEESTVPCEEATAELQVIGSNSLKFDKKAYSVPAGCLKMAFGGDGGHTLVFQEPPPAPFPKFAGPGEEAQYEIAAGEYVLYCDVSGHRQGGMEATLTVTGDGEAAPAAEA
jgi:hypothetical protein